MNKKEWYLSKELAGLPDLPKDQSNVTKKANKEGWLNRPAKGVKGGGLEFHFSSLPPATQKALGFSTENNIEITSSKSTQLREALLTLEAVMSSISLSDDEIELLDNYRACSKKAKLAIIQTVKTFAEQ